MTVKLITFKTNQTVMADVTEQVDTVVAKQTVQVVVQPQNGQPMMGFVPFLEYTEEFKTGIEFNKSDILTINSPVRELENEYNRLFGSGLEIASSIPKL
jgi:hypothetical protein